MAEDIIGSFNKADMLFLRILIKKIKALSTGICFHIILNCFHIVFISFLYRCHVDRSFSLKTMSLHFQIFPFWRLFSKESFPCSSKVKMQRKVCGFHENDNENVFLYPVPTPPTRPRQVSGLPTNRTKS